MYLSQDKTENNQCGKCNTEPTNEKEEGFPFDNMTLEEFADFFPENAINFVEDPTFWPHTPEEQINENEDA